MKILLIVALLLPNLAFAECNWKDIKKTDAGFVYPTACHKKVGKMVKDDISRKAQVTKLNKTITLKDLAIDTHLQRTELWRKTSYDLEDRLFKIERHSSRNKWIYFGLGFLGSSVAVWGASRLR